MVQEHTPIIQRDSILASFASELTRRSPRGAALIGPPWSGATSLAAALTATSQTAGWKTLTLRGAPGLRDIPFGTIAPLLRGSEQPSSDLAGLATARQVIEAHADGGRLIIAIDDAQWIDDLTAAVISQLTAQSIVPILVVSVADADTLPAGIQALLRDRAIIRHELAPLDEQAIRTIVDTLAGGPVDPLTTHTIVTRAQGLPALAAELTEGAVRTGALRAEGTVLRQRGEIRIPASVAERVRADLTDLAPQVRHAVETIAVTGDLPRDLAASVVGDAALIEAGRRGLIELRIDGNRQVVAVRNPLIGDVVRQHLAPIDVVEAARSVRASLRTEEHRRSDDPLLLGLLTLISGEPIDPDHALGWATRAGTLGRTNLALRFATEAANKRPDDCRAACLRSEFLVLDGRSREAEQLLAALAPADNDDLALVAMTRATNLFTYLDEPKRAFEVLDDANDQLAGTPWQAEIQGLSAVFTLFLGHPLAALEQVNDQLVSGEGRGLVEAITAAGPALVVAGRPVQAAALAQRGFDERVALGDQPTLSNPGIHLVSRSLALGEIGELDEALACAELVRAGAASEHSRDGMLWGAMTGGRSLLTMGRLDDALVWFQTASDLAAELGMRLQRRWALSGVVLSLAMQGRHVDMDQASLELESAPEPVARLLVSEVTRAFAWAAAVSGDLAAAQRHLNIATNDALDMGQALIALLVAHDATRLDLTIDLSIEEIVDFGSAIEGPLAQARLRHIVGLATFDPITVAAAGEDFAALGANILAAEATNQAAGLQARTGDRRAAERLHHRSGQLRRLCQSATTPALAWSDRASVLTRREREIALSAASGMASKEIAAQLGISVRTVNNLLQRVYRKLDVHDRQEMAKELTRTEPIA